MKPGIPETGTVVSLNGDRAVIRMKKDGSCGKCGVAAAGLCTGGLMQVLTVKNTKHARVGDTVKIGLVRGVKFKGYFLAYVVPSAALILGAAGGRFLGEPLGFPALEVILAFFSLFVGSYFSLRQLKRLDSSHSIEIVSVLYDSGKPGSPGPEEDTISDYYLSYY